MGDNIRAGLISGIAFGVIIIITSLIGFFGTVSALLGEFLFDPKTQPAALYSLVLILALLGLWAGIRAAKPVGTDRWSGALVSGAVAGLSTGLFVGIYTLIIGGFNARGLDIRGYLAQMSPDAIRFLLFQLPPATAALSYFLLFTTTGLAGGFLAKTLGRGRLKKANQQLKSKITELWESTSVAVWLSKFPYTQYIVYGAIIILALLLPISLGQYWNFTLGTVGVYVLMGLGINIVVGMAGLLDLGYVAFFAVGAYTVGLLTSPQQLSQFQIDFWPAAFLAIVIAAITGIILGFPVLRLRGDYLAIVTLGFGEIIRILVRSDLLSDFTGGPQGVRQIDGPSLFGISLTNDRAYLYMIILAIMLAIFVTIRFKDSRVGRAWVAMREDETVSQAMGINTYTTKLLAFAVGAAFAGLGGVLFASRNQYIGPEDANLLVSINVLAVVIVGGMGSIPGVFLGAFVLKGLPEIMRQLQDYRILAFGALLVVMMIVRPEGLWPSQRRRLEMHEEELPLEELEETEAIGALEAALEESTK
jgi:ABC-type branched-subunit amino acid transport system permease subunit